MRVISKARLRQFWEMPGQIDAEGPLRAWYTYVNNKTVDWNSWADIRSAYGTASPVGNCVVFNIGGNKFRLVTRVSYRSHKVYILKVMTHKEYDKNTWAKECGCFENQPHKQASNGKLRRYPK